MENRNSISTILMTIGICVMVLCFITGIVVSYNKILKAAGDEIIVSDAGGGIFNFNFNSYSSIIRPLLFEKLHIIDQDVRLKIQEIDYDLGRTSFFEDATTEDHDGLASRYNRMITVIESKYQNQ